MTPARERLDPRAVRRTMRLSVVDGAVYALMVGLGEVYFLADALRLGASPLVLGLVVSLPLCIGAVGPLLALRLLRRLSARRPLVVVMALAQAGMLFLLSAADLLRVSSASSLLAAVCLYQVFGQAAGTAWSSWLGDLVPRDVRGSYFSRRNRAAYVGTLGGLLAGGLLLQHLEPGSAAQVLGDGGRGFAVLFGLAGFLRLVSAALLVASSEAPFHGLSDGVRVRRYFAGERGSRAWRLVCLVAALQYAVYLAAPYFQPFMLKTLSFTYVEYMLANMILIAAKVAFLPAWGRSIDQFGARPLCVLSALLLALVPLPWLWAGGLGWVMLAQAFSGFSWAGFEVAQFSLLLESSYRGTRPHVFAALSVASGLAQLLGSLTGALLLEWVAGVQVLFAISLVARLLVATSFSRLLPARDGARPVGHRDLLLRVVGIRPNGGVTHRPVAAQLARPAAEETRSGAP